MSVRLVLVAVLAAGIALTGCQARLGADIRVDADGAGRFELAVAVDEQLTRDLRDAGVDVTDVIGDLRGAASPWTIQRRRPETGLDIRLRADFDGPEQFVRLTERLNETLRRVGLRLSDGLRLERMDGGVIGVRGQIGLVVSDAAGTGTGPPAVDVDDLRRLLDERGDEFVRYDLRVTLPEPPADHDADHVAGSTLTWRAPAGELRSIAATSRSPGSDAIVLFGIVVATALLTFTTITLITQVRDRHRSPLGTGARVKSAG